MGRIALDLTGQVFGRLTVLERAPNRGRNAAWLCRCSCTGVETVVQGAHLQSGNTTSCGCVRRERNSETKTTHGLSRHPLQGTHNSMIHRCHTPDHKQYPDYGGRGIQVCPRWRFGEDGLSGLACFIQDMGPKPSPDHSIDRRDNNGNYEPSNCQWATHSEQMNNRRPRSEWKDAKLLDQLQAENAELQAENAELKSQMSLVMFYTSLLRYQTS